MCPVQTTYAEEQAKAQEGQRANLGAYNSISKAAEDSDIKFGRAVVRGTADNQALLAVATAGVFLGITEFTTAWAADADDEHLYAENREMNILNFGYVWVITEDACVPGDDVFFRHTITGVEELGTLRTDADGTDADQIPGATFESTAGAGELALVKLPQLA